MPLPLVSTGDLLVVFTVGYVGIALEHRLGVNKAAVALLMATALWTLVLLGGPIAPDVASAALLEHLSSASQVIFFLLGAMTVVEVIDAHGAFRILTDRIRTRSRRLIMVTVGTVTFFMSSVLDNLTTTIVMAALLRRLIAEREERWVLAGLVVVAANAGGAWTPIGDVTTTMLWIGGQVSGAGIVRALFLPSLLSLVAALAWLWFFLSGEYAVSDTGAAHVTPMMHRGARRVLVLGLAAFVMVPILKTYAHVPPFLGIGAGLSAVWVLTDLVHRSDDGGGVRVPHALARIDVSAAFFFLGILLAVGALESAGALHGIARSLDASLGHPALLAGTVGLLSAFVDNVPIVAAVMSMYPLEQFPPDGAFWALIAFSAGTGGSILIIGSAAGVALMGIEQISFGWWVRKITPMALLGYVAGLLACVALD